MAFDRIRISETQIHELKGEFPEVPTYTHVDTGLLYEGDAEPLHLVLPIAEIGRVSENGLTYDEELVMSIAEQMSSGGVGGIGGHIPDEALKYAYPTDEVHWIGHLLQGNVLYAKGYIPPGTRRDDIRRKKARNGGIATSIFGDAVKEYSQGKGKKTWRARQFVLEQIDLAPAMRASLKNKRGYELTREMEASEMTGLNETITVADVPEPIREQIIRESEAGKKLERLSEMESKISEMETQVAELATYKQIVLEIRTTLGKDTDTAAAVAEQHQMASKLAEMLGVDYANITITVQEMHETIKEFQQKAFDGAVDSQVAALTNWNALTDAGKAKVAAFRKNFKRAVLAELKDERTPEKIAEISQSVWDEDFSLIAETVVIALGGPSAAIGGKVNPVGDGTRKISDEELEKNAAKYNAGKN